VVSGKFTLSCERGRFVLVIKDTIPAYSRV
jgi:hypothetical protein